MVSVIELININAKKYAFVNDNNEAAKFVNDNDAVFTAVALAA